MKHFHFSCLCPRCVREEGTATPQIAALAVRILKHLLLHILLQLLLRFRLHILLYLLLLILLHLLLHLLLQVFQYSLAAAVQQGAGDKERALLTSLRWAVLCRVVLYCIRFRRRQGIYSQI